MEPKKTKYDTNPLDPDYVKNTEEVWREGGQGGQGDNGPGTQEVRGATREIGASANENARANIYSEAPTRRYDNLPLDSPYQSILVPPTHAQPDAYQAPPAPYQPPSAPYQSGSGKPTSRTVAGLGLPEKWAMIIPYFPFYIGMVVSLIELLLVPRRELRVRFHAAQGLALHAAILVVQTVFGVIGAITDSSIGSSLFGLATLVFLVISIIRVWKGEPHHIAPIAEPAQWFNQHIESRNKS